MKTTIQFISLTLLAMMLTATVFAAQITVQGKIYDAQDKTPIWGGTIRIVGDSLVVVSNSEGVFSIVANKGDLLEINMIGYLMQRVKVKESAMTIYLQPNKEVLEQVIIVGGTQASAQTLMTESVSRNSKRRFHYLPTVDERDSEEYESLKENRFFSATDKPLSTISLDVDAASYANVRRMINKGQKPTKDAVRIEEMINYFGYDYPQPTDGHPVKIITEIGKCPWNEQHQLLRIGVKAKEIPSESLPASNFVFLIDVSGSMYGANRLPLVKASMKMLVNNLRAKDRVAIVTYAGAAGEVLPSTNGDNKQKIIDALNKLEAGGSTAGGAGIQLAYKIAEKNFIKDGNNRVILCTDGDFNVGVSSVSGLESLIEAKRKTGVYLTVLGYGMGNYKDNKLQTLSQKGNGNHAYIDNLQEANKVLVNEFGSTMYTVAKDVKIQVEFNPAFVNAYRLIGYESRLLADEDFNDDMKDAGELGAGHTVTAFYEIVPVGVDAPVGKIDKLKYQNTKKDTPTLTNSNELLAIKLRYKRPDEDKSVKMEIPVIAKHTAQGMSKDFYFASAVTMFGQLLRDSNFKGNTTYEKVLEMARLGLDDDPHGYRREFIRLVETVSRLTE